MTFGKDFGLLEISLIAGFILVYIGYLLRVRHIAHVMRTKKRSVFYKLILRTSYFLLIIFALLAPSFGEMKREVKAIGKDIYVCVDLSKSMDATDVQPSRLAKVKFELKNLVKAFNSDRIGLIVFTNEAFMQCPLTYDGNALSMFIETLNTDLISTSGTDFAPPIDMAINKLDDAEEGLPPNKSQSKIIILISDGEDFGDATESAANDVKAQGVKLFTLGVGTSAGGKIPAGYRFKRDRKGNDVLTKLNDQSLRSLADMTEGQYFEISDRRNDVDRMITAIESIEGELRGAKKMDVAANKYYYFLALAVMLIGLDILFTVKIVKF